MNIQAIYKIRLKKGDTVIVRSGKYKGQTGKVLATHPSLNKVTIEGVNVFKKHQKPSRQHPQGGIIEITKPIWVSKVGLYDAANKKAVRIAYKIDKDGNKLRINAKTKKEVQNG